MARIKRLNIRITEEEFSVLNAYAESRNLAMSEVIREWIKRYANDEQAQMANLLQRFRGSSQAVNDETNEIHRMIREIHLIVTTSKI